MRNFTVKVFFNDGGQISVDCDDFVATDGSHYCAVRDGIRIMTFPFCSVKYTVTVDNTQRADKAEQCRSETVSKGEGKVNPEEAKKELIDVLVEMRKEYFSVLFKECRLKDVYGNVWDIQRVEFDDNWTILRLGLRDTENYTCVMIATDGSTNELKEYELIEKEAE